MYGCAAGATATRRATAGGCGGSEMATRQPPVHTQVSAVLYGEKLRNGAVGATVNALWSVAMPSGGRTFFVVVLCANFTVKFTPAKRCRLQPPGPACSENRDLLSGLASLQPAAEPRARRRTTVSSPPVPHKAAHCTLQSAPHPCTAAQGGQPHRPDPQLHYSLSRTLLY